MSIYMCTCTSIQTHTHTQATATQSRTGLVGAADLAVGCVGVAVTVKVYTCAWVGQPVSRSFVDRVSRTPTRTQNAPVGQVVHDEGGGLALLGRVLLSFVLLD
jgi:hypothetical protein